MGSIDKWFEGSRVVKKDGSPRIVYHGTEKGDFDSFETPAFFTASRDEAEAYAMYTDTYGDTRISYEPVGNRKFKDPIDASEIWPIMSDYDGPPNKISLTGETDEEDIIRYFYWDGTENPVGDKNFVVLSGVKVVASGFGKDFNMKVVYGPTEDTLAREPRKLDRRVYKCYLSIKNPIILPWWDANLLGKRLGADSDSVNDKISKWEAEGYDGIVTASDSGIVFHGATVTNWIAFRTEQVKVIDVETIEESISTKILMIVEEILSEEGTEESEGCKEDAIKVIHTLQKAGFQAVFAGGCVRDAAMGTEPHDYDVATSATVEDVNKLFPKVIHVGETFGVTRVLMPSGVIEVATFRKDIGSEGGRRPASIESADMEGDAARRDFTINAMFHDPISDKIHDYVGGMADLRNKTLRFVGDPDERIKEDHLRMLRLVRFAAKLGFIPEESSVEAVRKNAELIRKISAERIRQETTKMITGPNPDKAIEMLQDTGLLEQFLPEVSGLDGVEQAPENHPEGDAFRHTLVVLSLLKNPSEELAWAALLHDIGKKSTSFFDPKKGRISALGHEKAGEELVGPILKRLKFSNKVADNILWLVANHMKMHHFLEIGDVKKAALIRNPMFDTLIDLTSADSRSTGKEDPAPELREFVKNAPNRLRSSEPLIDGNDLR